MAQHDLDIANAAGNVVRADINSALVALGTNQKGPTAPASPAAGWIWVDDNTPSAAVWNVSMYDGAAWILLGTLDTTNDRFTASGAALWGGTAGGTANALTVTSVPAPAARYAGLSFTFIVASANTAAATLNDNALGAVAIRRPDGTALLPSDLLAGEMVTVVWDGSVWRLADWPDAMMRVDRRTASASAQIDIALPAGFTEFVLEYSAVRPGTDGANLQLRTSTDGGATFAATAGDYGLTLSAQRPGTGTVLVVSPTTPAAVQLSSDADATLTSVTINGRVKFFIGDGTRQPWFQIEASQYENAAAVLSRMDGAGWRSAAPAINAIRLMMNTGTISSGRFWLYGVR